MNFKNKKITIMGLGLHGGGVAVAKWLAKQGATLTVTDLKTKKELTPSLAKLKKFKNIKYVLGRHREQDFKIPDLIIQNPGVPRESKYLQVARQNNIPIVNEASLFFQLVNPKQIIGITGTRGKSTTTTLIYEMLRQAKKSALLGGNIRISTMFDIVDKVKPKSLAVLELSSWQLENMADIKTSPHIAVMTNLFPDHLNRYRGIKDYGQAKENIFQWQGPQDFVVLNKDNQYTRDMGKRVIAQRLWFSQKYFPDQNGCLIKNNWLIFRWQGKENKVCQVSDIKLTGQHNLSNVLASVTAAKIFKINNSAIKKTLQKFSGLADRQELIAAKQGIKYYNDTTATTPEATIAALQTLSQGKNIVLLAGGSDKKLKFTELARVIKQKAKAVVLFEDTATPKLVKALKQVKADKLILGKVKNMKQAIKLAKSVAVRGDIILLSPACASFGLFINEFDRGEQFKKIIK